MAKLFKLDGSISHIEPQNKENGFSLEECYSHVGCELVEIVRVSDTEILIGDQDGDFKAYPQVNMKILKKFKVTFFGNVLLCYDKEFK